MAFPVDDILLGPDTFGRLHRLDMVIGHTGEEPGFSRDYAVATTIWQRSNPGSYSFRIYDAESEGSRGGVLLTVPWMEASGGINPFSAYWAPERFPWLEEALAESGPCPVPNCPGPYRNPTMHAGQISFTGRTDRLEVSAPANYVPDAERLIGWYEGHPLRGPAPLVLIMHGHWQRNRTDWGRWMHAQLTGIEEEDIMSRTWLPRTVEWTTVPGEPFRGPDGVGGPMIEKSFKTAERVTTFLEEVEINDGKITTPMDRHLLAAYPDPRIGPEVLDFPRTSLTDPSPYRDGLPLTEVEVPTGITQVQVTAAADKARKATNQTWREWLETAP